MRARDLAAIAWLAGGFVALYRLIEWVGLYFLGVV